MPLAFCACVALLLLLLHQMDTADSDAGEIRARRRDGVDYRKPLGDMGAVLQESGEVVFLMILCEGEEDDDGPTTMAADVNRQIQHSGVLLKSAAALTATRLRFIVVANSKSLYSRIVNETLPWPDVYRAKVRFQYLPVWYPEDRVHMMSMFRVCATERLFVPSMLPDEDAVIYIDTDLIFMRPPEDLWAEFHKFDSRQVAAMAPCLYHYGTSRTSKVPFYGKSGLNAGVMHMNLTRMKNISDGGWVEANMKVFDQYRRDIVLADQDILNVLFYKYPELLYELGCEWNYRMFQCMNGWNECPSTSTKGAAVVHGNALVFASGEERKMQTLYESWQAHSLETPLLQLYRTIRKNLKQVTLKKEPTKCGKLKEIDLVLSHQLFRHLQKRGKAE